MDFLQLQICRIVKQRKAAQEYIPLHAHDDTFQCLYSISGRGEIQLGEARHPAPAGSFFRFDPGVPHAIYGIMDFESIDFKFTAPAATAARLGALPPRCMLDRYEATLIEGAFSEAVAGACGMEELVTIKLTELFLRQLRRQTAPAVLSFFGGMDERQAKTPALRACAAYLRTHLEQPLTESDLAAQFGYSESYLSTLFKKELGYPPMRYRNLLRVARAQQLMLTGVDSVTAVAAAVGMDPHAFARLFKNTTGQSPAAYLRRANSDRGISLQPGGAVPQGGFAIPKQILPSD